MGSKVLWLLPKNMKYNIGKNSIGKFYRVKDGAVWQYWRGDLNDNLSEEEKREGMLVRCSPLKVYLQRKDGSIIRVRKYDIEEKK